MSRPTCVVFLDVDGVLLPFGDGAAVTADGGFPDEPLAALSAILEATGATIVLSSTWRCAPESIAELTSAFFFYACEHGGPLGSVASFEHTTNHAHSTRQWEIAEWLASPAAACVEQWVALDDEPLLDGASNARHRASFEGHTVQTESTVGLTRAHAARAIALLGGLERQRAPSSGQMRRSARIVKRRRRLPGLMLRRLGSSYLGFSLARRPRLERSWQRRSASRAVERRPTGGLNMT